MRKLAIILLLLSGSAIAEDTQYINRSDCFKVSDILIHNKNYSMKGFNPVFVGEIHTIVLECHKNIIITYSRDEWLALEQQQQTKRERQEQQRRNELNDLKQKYNIR